mgnify:CR=1 FL=1
MASGKKQGMHPTSKSYADNLGKLAGKSIAQGAHQYSNLSAKMLIGQSSGTTGHSKKLSKQLVLRFQISKSIFTGTRGVVSQQPNQQVRPLCIRQVGRLRPSYLLG